MNFKSVLILLFSITLFACTKEEDNTESSSTSVDEYMNATVNNKAVEADFVVILQDPVFNGFYPSSKYFQIQRLVENGSAEGFNMVVERINLNTIDYPFTLRYSENNAASTLLFNYYDEDDKGYAMNIADSSSFTVILTSYDDKVLTGTFEGELYTEDKSSVTVENGTFQIEMVVY